MHIFKKNSKHQIRLKNAGVNAEKGENHNLRKTPEHRRRIAGKMKIYLKPDAVNQAFDLVADNHEMMEESTLLTA